MNKYWTIKNKADENAADIFIYGDIEKLKSWSDTNISAKGFGYEFQYLVESGVNKINLHINSAGGDVFEALAIYNVLKNFAGTVNCFIEGICASAATIISAGCSKVSMAENSLFMIHNVFAGLEGSYDTGMLEQIKNSLDKVRGTVIEIYKNRTGKTDEEISELMNAETWYTAEEALENNFVDEIIGAVESSFDNAKKILFVNKLKVDCRKFDTAQIDNRVAAKNFAAMKFLNITHDNLHSGAEGVTDSIPHKVDKKAEMVNLIAKYL